MTEQNGTYRAWVSTQKYCGPCRRAANTFVILGRRRCNTATPLPSLEITIRRLRVCLPHRWTDKQRIAYRRMLYEAAQLATAHGQGDIADSLSSIETRLLECQTALAPASVYHRLMELTVNAYERSSPIGSA